ncbi:multiple sugar transport system substrate-binding protein [Microbacterium endophyticum]|uniref:Multiple sugar transport system substrate-binding protein n=1 Tax=Microbacterium endophyticum TaxID=1526412 RepID=A0A7W4V5B1_9MICO|nr:sugar ABC transporter substrate-binding protein [Microbacterium endophyticum]MBB2977131.1 multiple sugar transport system substrate-binding protein [Microbacterium endophyticum]NIK36059.1 multiple sugar transport system substrate-binding protein [Microbacterium endophyticum]
MTIFTSGSSRITRRVLPAIGLTAAVALVAAGCAGGDSDPSSRVEAGDGTGTITVWALDGQSAENEAIQKIMDDFESENPDNTIDMQFIPADQFTTALLTASDDELPDVVEVDGPVIASFAYNGRIAPIDDWVSQETIDNQTTAIQGQNTVDGDLYAVGMMNSGLAMWGNKSLLDAAGVTMPTSTEDAWTAEEFSDVLAKLAAVDDDGKPLGIGEANGFTSEYGIYAFAPVVWSAGSPILEDGKAAGALDSQAAVDSLTTFASWREYTDPDTDGNAFQSGRVALNWMGNWLYPAYVEALGDDLVVGPLPDFGDGAKTGSGTIAWSMGGATKNATGAGNLLDYLMSDAVVEEYTAANGAPPATKTALEASSLYGEGKPLAFLTEQLDAACPTEDMLAVDCVAVSRPVTPGYPVVTAEFGKALAAIWGGADAAESLQSAARAIDRDFADNGNYED